MKIICIGRNYTAHASELHNPVPEAPVVFLKPDTAIPQRNSPFFIPSFSKDVHYEVELVFRISRNGKNVSEKFASRYFDQVTVGIDFTARDVQANLKKKGLPWELSKSFDGSAAVGDFIPLDSLPDPMHIGFQLDLNGKTMQRGNSADMLFPIGRIIAFVSSYITLKEGDLIFTGTPAGVGPVAKGDLLEAYIGDKILLRVPVR